MTPLLFASNARNFDSLGYGEVSEATKCEVYESTKGDFELTMDVPPTAKYFGLLNVGTLVVADANETLKRQAFEIYQITKPLKGLVHVYAYHISYRLRYSVLRPFTVSGAANVFARLNTINTTNYIEGNAFTFATDITSNATVTVKEYASVRDVLGGMEGSILDTFGGVYKWDNFQVSLLRNRGSDNGVRILYGKNLKGFEADYDNADAFTGIYPYYVKSDGTLVAGTTIARSTYADRYAYRRTVAREYNTHFGSTVPTAAQLDAIAAQEVANQGLPDVNLKADVIPLHATIEYKSFAPLERMQLDDTVHVYVPTLDVDVKAKVIAVRYNVLLDRVDSVEIGNFKTTLADAIRAL